MLPLVAVLAVFVGLGAGWLAFEREAILPGMTAEQQETLTDLEASGTLDPGSVRLLGSKHGADVWEATRDEGALTCLVLTKTTSQQSHACEEWRDDSYGLGVQTSLTIEEDGKQIMVWAVLVENIDGERVAIMQRQNADDAWDWRSQYTESELAIVDVIEADGFEGQWLQLVGYDGDLPIWMHQAERSCAIVVQNGGNIAQECTDAVLDIDQTVDLSLPGVTYSVRNTANRGMTLTIIRTPGIDAVRCDTGTGACESIDDKTGDVE